MFSNISLDIKLRKELLSQGINEEATEIFVYMNKVTEGGKKGIKPFETFSIGTKVMLYLTSFIPAIKSHTENFSKLYQDSEFRTEWYEQFEQYCLHDSRILHYLK